MSIKKNKKPISEETPKETQPTKHWQSFKVKIKFPTEDKTYDVGETFRHYDKKVINFLKSKNII